MSSSSIANEKKMDDVYVDVYVDVDVQLNTLETLSVRESYPMISNFNNVLDILEKIDIKEQSKGGLLINDEDIFENLYLLFNDQYKNTIEKICMKTKSNVNATEITLVNSEEMKEPEQMSELEQWKSELKQWKSKLNELQRIKDVKRKSNPEIVNIDNGNNKNKNREVVQAKRTKVVKGGVLSDDSIQMDLIRNTDCVHDFGFICF